MYILSRDSLNIRSETQVVHLLDQAEVDSDWLSPQSSQTHHIHNNEVAHAKLFPDNVNTPQERKEMETNESVCAELEEKNKAFMSLMDNYQYINTKHYT